MSTPKPTKVYREALERLIRRAYGEDSVTIGHIPADPERDADLLVLEALIELEALREENVDLDKRGRELTEDYNQNLAREERLWHAANAIASRLAVEMPMNLPPESKMVWTKNPPTVGEIRTLVAALREGPLAALASAPAKPEMRWVAYTVDDSQGAQGHWEIRVAGQWARLTDVIAVVEDSVEKS